MTEAPPSLSEQRTQARANVPRQTAAQRLIAESRPTPGAQPETASEAPVVPATPPQGSSLLSLPQESPKDVELPDGSSTKAADSFRTVKTQRDAFQQERDQIKAELETARRELEATKASGTKVEQIEANETYLALKKESEQFKSRVGQYEQELGEERKKREEYEGKLAKYSLADDPEFQERYERPFKDLERDIVDRIQGLNADAPDHARKVMGMLGAALSEVTDQDFYAGLGRVRNLDPDNYPLYLSDAQALRRLGKAKEAAMESHQQTRQQLREESAKNRERTIPDVFRVLDEVTGRIKQDEAPLEEALNSPQYEEFLKKQGIDPRAVDNLLREAVKASHLEGRPTAELIALAAQGARKEKLKPWLATVEPQRKALEEENKRLKDELAAMRGGQSFRPSGGAPGASNGTSEKRSFTREEFNAMSAEDRKRGSGQWAKQSFGH